MIVDQNLHKMIHCEHLTLNRWLVQGVSKFNIFLKWPLQNLLNKIQNLKFLKLL